MNNFLFFILLAAASPAAAYFDAGGRYTSGPSGYSGVSSFVEWGGDSYYFRPGVNTYKSDLSDRISSYSLGAGLDRPSWSGGAEISMTPETSGYKNTGIYADFKYMLFREQPEDAALQGASLGVFAGYTAHEDSFAASTATVSSGRRGGAKSSLTSAFRLKQTDYGVSAGLKLWRSRLNARFSKTAYDQDITALDRKLPLNIGGIGASGFQDKAVSAGLRLPSVFLSPELGYAKTWYLLDQPVSESVSAGLSHKFGTTEVSAGWERFNPGGGAGASDYWSLGLTLSF